MSSFKRRTTSKQVALAPGTRACPISTSTVLTSSGIPSLDDILGGGVPLSCSVAILAPDSQSAYDALVQKYFIAQGIANGHKVCIAHEDALSFASECMWMPASKSNAVADDVVQSEDKIKIAWRYERMNKFETTVDDGSADRFCDTFDLSCRIPTSLIDEARDAKRLVPFNLALEGDPTSLMDRYTRRMEDVLATTPSSEVVRLSITSLGSPEWGDHTPADVFGFLYALRRLLRRYPHACACVSLAPHVSTDTWGGPGWVQKVGWVTDGTFSITGFGGNLALTALFPSHHGLVTVHKLPAPHSILATSDKCSALRGLSSSAGASAGTGENNLAFRCTRKRFVFETMHLDVEGGISERRTTPSLATIDSVVHTHVTDRELASIGVEMEETAGSEPRVGAETGGRARNRKKKVAFRSEKPDLCDF